MSEVTPGNREDVQELIATMRRYAEMYGDNYQIELAAVLVQAADALEATLAPVTPGEGKENA